MVEVCLTSFVTNFATGQLNTMCVFLPSHTLRFCSILTDNSSKKL